VRPEETALLHGAGRLRCLGGQQHLKSKYGGGYTLELRVGGEAAGGGGGGGGGGRGGGGEEAHEGVCRLFPGARLIEHVAGRSKYELPSGAPRRAERSRE